MKPTDHPRPRSSFSLRFAELITPARSDVPIAASIRASRRRLDQGTTKSVGRCFTSLSDEQAFVQGKKRQLNINISKFAGLSRVWAGEKICLCVFSGHSLWGSLNQGKTKGQQLKGKIVS